MDSMPKKSHILIFPYGMYCDYDMFLEKCYAHLSEEPKKILFIGPTYNVCSEELMTFCPQEFAELEDFANFDRSFFDKFNLKYNIERESLEFEREELLYRHVDYLKKNFPEYKTFPIFYNKIKPGVIKSIIQDFWGECSFIFLTAMSIGNQQDEAKRKDEFHAKELENNRANNLTHLDFSAYRILPELVEFSRVNHFVFRRIALQNSGDFGGRLEATTGYGAWYLDENVK